jgi:hypothetical protein
MDDELKTVIKKHIDTIHERYNFALIQTAKSKTQADVAFLEGASFAYYDVLKRLRSQLEAQGYDPSAFDPIVPELGKPTWQQPQQP